MESRLEAAQRGLFVLLAVTVVVLLVCWPKPGDARTARAYEELAELARVVDLPAAERMREAQARHFAEVQLSELLLPPEVPQAGPRQVKSRPPTWAIAEDAHAVTPAARLKLQNLGDVKAQMSESVPAAVLVPTSDHLKTIVAHRFSALGLTGTPTITGATLELAELGPLAIERELEAERMSKQLLDARAQVERAGRKVEFAQKRVEARKKRRSRSIDKFRETLATFVAQRDTRAAALSDLQGRYVALVQENTTRTESAPLRARPDLLPSVGRLRITYRDAQAKLFQFSVPVVLSQRSVSLPPLIIPGVTGELAVASRHEAWAELQALTPELARVELAQRLSWHSRSVRLLGFELFGSWLLQVAPCLVALGLLSAVRRAGHAATSHRLFSTQLRGKLPRVGFKKRAHELVVMVLMPLTACLLSAISLWLLRSLPMLPALAFTVSLPLTLRLYARVDELRVLNRSITHYHSSYPPPALAGDQGLEGEAA